MRAGVYSIQQSLTIDASDIVKQAVNLTRRRGHAQVTPLHVVSAMLSSPASLLRSACLQSHSHPLQCKALELCFNVALNRLPISSSSSPLYPSPHPPSLSNALIAALKRAQAHQRRGSTETQQQQQLLLAVKIELQQLIVSMLDDPSVSRVMREAGFSSIQIKSNIEQASSSKPPKPGTDEKRATPPQNSIEDITSFFECLLRFKKRSVVVVGECLASTEDVVKGFMERVDNGQVPNGLRNLKFVNVLLYSFNGMSRGQVEQKVRDLKALLLENICVGRGAVLYLGDMKWIAEFRASRNNNDKGGALYCPVEHVIMEIRSLILAEIKRGDKGESVVGGSFWLLGIASLQTYMKCKNGDPSLEHVLGLQPFTIPVGLLELTLNFGCRDAQSLQISSTNGVWPIQEDAATKQLNCSTNFTIKLERDARDEDWLESAYRLQNNTLHLSSSASPSSFTTSYNHTKTAATLHVSPESKMEWLSLDSTSTGFNLNLQAFPFADSINSSPNKFKELNAENLKILCNSLERKVPWQKALIPGIVNTILECRAGMVTKDKQGTWLLFHGKDVEGKEKIARELAGLLFGYSQTSFFTFELSCSTSPDRSKRQKSEQNKGLFGMLAEAIQENPHRVFFVEDLEQGFIEYAIKRDNLREFDGAEEVAAVKDFIVILSCESFDTTVGDCYFPSLKRKKTHKEEAAEVIGNRKDSFLSLDLNVCAEENETGESLLGAIDRAFFFQMAEDL